MLELWDIRTYKKFRIIDWDGPKAIDVPVSELEDDEEKGKESGHESGEEEENKENLDPEKQLDGK